MDQQQISIQIMDSNKILLEDTFAFIKSSMTESEKKNTGNRSDAMLLHRKAGFLKPHLEVVLPGAEKPTYEQLEKKITELEDLLAINKQESLQREVIATDDVTDGRFPEEKSWESQRQLADIIEFLPDATLVIDKEGKIIAWNRAIEAMTGVKKENMIGKDNHEYALPFYGERRDMLADFILHPDKEIEKKYTAIQRTGDVLLGDTYASNLPGNLHLSGTASVLRDNSGEVIAAIECIRDTTERKKLEERLNRAQKMEALGTLAGGVAHDLNNVLGVLVGYSELMKLYLPKGSRSSSMPKTYCNQVFGQRPLFRIC